MTREVVCRSYATSPNELFLTAACRNLPQLKLSRPGTCSRALRMAISDTASTTHSKFALPTLAASPSVPTPQTTLMTVPPSPLPTTPLLHAEPMDIAAVHAARRMSSRELHRFRFDVD